MAELRDYRLTGLIVANLTFAIAAPGASRRRDLAWIVALLCSLLARPLSNLPHIYLLMYMAVTRSVNIALLIERLLKVASSRPGAGVVGIFLVFAAFFPGIPVYFSWPASVRAIAHWSDPPQQAPIGYAMVPGSPNPCLAAYPWNQYRAAIRYLRSEIGPRTKVANVLLCQPAISGPTGLLPALPAESLWLVTLYNRPEDLDRYLTRLEHEPDSVVVWSPQESRLAAPQSEVESSFRLGRLAQLIVRLYEPALRFGVIEIWKRRSASR